VSSYEDVDREALHDWLDQRDELAADERPDPSEYLDDEDWRDGLEPEDFDGA
jgi:hypothetical protein